MTYVLDACAMIAYLQNEDGGVAVDEILRNGQETCIAHAANLCEVYYDILRRSDEATANAAIQDLLAVGIVERDDLDPDFWRAAGSIKATARASLADCFCIALARRVSGSVLTSDHKEFDPIQAAGVCAVHFFR